ncbi:unnamed protein product [Rhizoctonia solani]|uniref:Uncharacterized protein n=1 Tax=Rhizoctonia solani TaxID=456999 RepID=A0A8H3AMY0_9AGAM|nr:unnamed protein product [Rhizoctonia solani]
MFDMIAGTRTIGCVSTKVDFGGSCDCRKSIIAILLGRLELQIEDAIEAYQQIVKDTFSERKLSGEGAFKTTNLENTITRVVEQYTGRTDTLMMDPGGCKTFVCAMQANNMTTGIPTLIRTYSVPRNDGPKCKITQAALAR